MKRKNIWIRLFDEFGVVYSLVMFEWEVDGDYKRFLGIRAQIRITGYKK